MKEADEKRIAVIGLDGMAWHVLDRLFEYGAMPNLRKLSETSLKGILKSTLPPYTPPAWTSIATGVNPGKHGIFGFTSLTKGCNGVKIVSSLDVCYPRVHEMVALKGLKSICVNHPLTYPVLKIDNAVVISDWIGPTVSFYPKQIKKYADKYTPYNPTKKFGDLNVFLKSMLNEVEKRIDVVSNMMKELDWSLFWVVFSEPDHVMHKAYEEIQRGNDLALRIFNKLDEFIGDASTSADLTVIVSDHGLSRFRYLINVNTLLDRLGLISRTSNYVLKEFWHHKATQERADYIQIPLRAHRVLSFGPLKFLLKKIYKLVKGKDVKAKLPYVDPEKSKAFMHSVSSYGIFVRESRLIEDLISHMKSVEGIANVWRREEIYQGQFVERAPHIVFLPDFDSGYSTGTTAVSSKIISKQTSYNHTLDGIIIIHRKKAPSKSLGVVDTVDVVPTILSYLGLPIPIDVDGKAISEIANPSKRYYNYLKHWQLIKEVQIKKSKLALLS